MIEWVDAGIIGLLLTTNGIVWSIRATMVARISEFEKISARREVEIEALKKTASDHGIRLTKLEQAKA